MKLLRAILLGALLWILIFFEVSVLMFGFGLNAGNAIYYSLHFIFESLLTIIIILFYFYKSKIKKGFWQGILVGIVFVIMGIVLDSVITVPLFVKNYSFLIRPDILLYEIWGIILCGIVGLIRR